MPTCVTTGGWKFSSQIFEMGVKSIKRQAGTFGFSTHNKQYDYEYPRNQDRNSTQALWSDGFSAENVQENAKYTAVLSLC